MLDIMRAFRFRRQLVKDVQILDRRVDDLIEVVETMQRIIGRQQDEILKLKNKAIKPKRKR